MLRQRCPVGGEQVDESAARINGGLVVAVLLASLLLDAPWLLAYLTVDFCIKVFLGFAFSPNCQVARSIADLLRIEPRPVGSAPKRFAAMIGLVMSAAGLMAVYAFGNYLAFVTVTATFLLFASLESFAGVCVGCILYSLLPERFANSFVRAGGVR